MSYIILPRSTTICVGSYGGVGTTFLISFLRRFAQTNDPEDRDGFKHSPLPPISLNANTRFIYVYGDPRVATVSLFRRKYHHVQSLKLQKWGRTTCSPIPESMTLEAYVSAGVDGFNFRTHFLNWYETYLLHPTLFMKYEALFQNVEPLVEFLNLPHSAVDEFPAFQKRSSQIDDLPRSTAEALNTMYGPFAEELDRLPDVEVRTGSPGQSSLVTYLSAAYRVALLEHFRTCLSAFLRTRK